MPRGRRSLLLATWWSLGARVAIASGQQIAQSASPPDLPSDLPTAGQSRRIRGPRWLTITALSGSVELRPFGGEAGPAEVGDRLTRVGDILTTGSDSFVRLEVDLAVGFVTVAENSQMQIRTLSTTSSGGRITEIFVLRGRVNLRLRQLNNPDSRLEIYTPAGVTGVRGTEFGVTVRPDGQTGVATQEGRVASSAQGQTVFVEANQQSVIRPGEPPTPPAPLRDDPALFVEVIRPTGRRDEQGLSLVEVSGYTDLVNLLSVQGKQQPLDRAGRFEAIVSSSPDGRIPVLITTPLGTEQKYELVAP